MTTEAETTHPTSAGFGRGAGEPPLPERTFDDVFREEAAYASRALRYLGVAEAHLEDACQEVFVVVLRRLHEFRTGSLRAWVRQICVGVARNHRRSLRRRPEDSMDEVPDVAVPAAQDSELSGRDLQRRLLQILDRLGEEQRTVFVLYEIEQLTMAETAEAVGCPLQTAYSRLYAARSRVRAALGDSK